MVLPLSVDPAQDPAQGCSLSKTILVVPVTFTTISFCFAEPAHPLWNLGSGSCEICVVM